MAGYGNQATGYGKSGYRESACGSPVARSLPPASLDPVLIELLPQCVPMQAELAGG